MRNQDILPRRSLRDPGAALSAIGGAGGVRPKAPRDMAHGRHTTGATDELRRRGRASRRGEATPPIDGSLHGADPERRTGGGQDRGRPDSVSPDALDRGPDSPVALIAFVGAACALAFGWWDTAVLWLLEVTR